MKKHVLFDDGEVSWTVLARDPAKPQDIVDTNEYLIQSNDDSMLLDPGGIEVFPPVLTAISEVVSIDSIKAYLCSHQDPDIMSSLPLWMGITPKAKIYLSWLWKGFVSHFGHEFVDNFELVPDEGTVVELGGNRFTLVPAHHCHSAGNFHVFCPRSRILFSGDLGAALLPPEADIFVDDFESHTKYMEKFHLRWMPSNDAKNSWIRRVRKLNPRMICPQHGAIFRDQNATNLLDWLEDLDVGRLERAA